MLKKNILILGIIAFYIIFIIYSDIEKFSSNILNFDFKIFPIILGLLLLGIIIKAFRQQVFFKKLNIKISIKNGILLYFAGMSMIATPGGSGQLIKSYYLKKKFGFPISDTYPIVLIERLFDVISVTVILLFVTFLQGNERIILIEIIFLLFFISLLLVLKLKKSFNVLLKIINKIPVLKKQISNISKSQIIFQSLLSVPTISRGGILSMIAWILDALMIYLIFIGFGLNFDIVLTTFTSYVSLLLGVLSLSPAGIGVTEISYLGLLIRNNLDSSIAVSLIFLVRFVSVWVPTIMGIITSKLFMKKS